MIVGKKPRQSTLRAIVLAAGVGRRLYPYTNESPKCLLDLGGATLLEHQLRVLRDLGVGEVVVVTGYHDDKVRAACPADVTFVHNALYETTNSIYSLWLARAYLDRPCLVINADVLFSRKVLRLLLDSPVPDAVLYDSASGTDPEHTKVELAWHGRIKRIGKSIRPARSDGEYLGLMRLSQPAARTLVDELDRLVVERKRVMDWAPSALASMLDRRPLFAVDIESQTWIEIDFPEDLDRARRHVWPVIREENGADPYRSRT